MANEAFTVLYLTLHDMYLCSKYLSAPSKADGSPVVDVLSSASGAELPNLYFTAVLILYWTADADAEIRCFR